MDKKCVEFVVEYCKPICSSWSKCIAEAKGFDCPKDAKDLLACLILNEHERNGDPIMNHEDDYNEEIDSKWDLIKEQYIEV